MIRLKTLCLFTLICCLFLSNITAQESALIKIDPARTIDTIDPNIYGAFVEPIRTVVYGNIYDPESPFADENGFRKDFIDLIKELNIRNVRWPGGNFVSGYNWEDGIGPKDQRPAKLDLAWKQIETNQMGTDEYAKFCSLIGADNFLCINGGTGTLDDARNWVEYCNYEKGTYYSDLRRKYGNEEPFNVKYVGLGNEIDGPWQMGQKSVEDYCKFALEAGKLIEIIDEDIKLVASGSSLYRPGNKWVDWNEYVLDQMVGKIDYISIHRYASEALPGGRENDVFSDHMSLGLEIDEKIETTQASIEKAMVKSESERPVYISFDEYSPGFGGIRSALLLAQHLNSFIRHADIVKMANITMITGLTGHSPEGVFKNSLFHTFNLYSNNALGTALDVYTDAPTYDNEIFDNIPYLDVTAIYNESEKKVIVNVVNRHETDEIETKIDLQAGKYAGKATAKVINADNLDARNTLDESPVSVETRQMSFKGNVIQHTFPAHSFTQIEISTK
ncbi:alpha-N-arabinofuranosidase [Marinilabilia salmonicolor]|uniref:non-reducing end alpha-L-arabinofuranosidase n=1 Tax=Marinilabilia salmonicolor TaxID=989 RepID=A0A368UZ37_9BACT|nr:alpha-L-arabinofuranosidase C-terminal domain-containing protein [Marinilabilia salmonicolor]RCW33290.1 alpha-N-arabinofuranosidase [Marinilabilia salmonicolor]